MKAKMGLALAGLVCAAQAWGGADLAGQGKNFPKELAEQAGLNGETNRVYSGNIEAAGSAWYALAGSGGAVCVKKTLELESVRQFRTPAGGTLLLPAVKLSVREGDCARARAESAAQAQRLPETDVKEADGVLASYVKSAQRETLPSGLSVERWELGQVYSGFEKRVEQAGGCMARETKLLSMKTFRSGSEEVMLPETSDRQKPAPCASGS